VKRAVAANARLPASLLVKLHAALPISSANSPRNKEMKLSLQGLCFAAIFVAIHWEKGIFR
jgi:hypothetical protein